MHAHIHIRSDPPSVLAIICWLTFIILMIWLIRSTSNELEAMSVQFCKPDELSTESVSIGYMVRGDRDYRYTQIESENTCSDEIYVQTPRGKNLVQFLYHIGNNMDNLSKLELKVTTHENGLITKVVDLGKDKDSSVVFYRGVKIKLVEIE